MTSDFEMTVIAQLSEIRMEIARIDHRLEILEQEAIQRRSIGWTGVL